MREPTHPTTYGNKTIASTLIDVCKAKGYQNLSVSMPANSTTVTLFHNQQDILLTFRSSADQDGTNITIISYNCSLEKLHTIIKFLKTKLADIYVHIE